MTKAKAKTAKAKPRRVVIGEGLPNLQGSAFLSLTDRFGGRKYLKLSNLSGKWVRIVAEVLE
jgi:hypothetical protein